VSLSPLTLALSLQRERGFNSFSRLRGQGELLSKIKCPGVEGWDEG